MNGTALALVIGLVSSFENMTDTNIVLTDPTVTGIDRKVMTRDSICEKLGIGDCGSISYAAFPHSSMTEGASETFSITRPNGQIERVCVVTPPDNRFEPGASYVQKRVGYFDADMSGPFAHEIDADAKRAFNLLAQLAACASMENTSSDLEVERDLSFASLATQLIKGSDKFLSINGNTASSYYAHGTNSEAAKYGVAVAERILMNAWKQDLAENIEQNSRKQFGRACSTQVRNSREPHLVVFPTARPSSDGGIQECFEGDFYGQVEITDDSLRATVQSYSVEDQVLEDDEEMRDPNIGTPAPYNVTYRWEPFQSFNGDAHSGIRYAWQTANQITGLQ